MITKDQSDILQACFDNICKNYNIPAGLDISEPMLNRAVHDHLMIFLNIHAASVCNFCEEEICVNLLKTGIKSKKDYRTLRSLVRTRLIDAIRGLRDLTEDSLRNLGAKV